MTARLRLVAVLVGLNRHSKLTLVGPLGFYVSVSVQNIVHVIMRREGVVLNRVGRHMSLRCDVSGQGLVWFYYPHFLRKRSTAGPHRSGIVESDEPSKSHDNMVRIRTLPAAPA